MEVEHVKAHRTKREREHTTQFEMFVTEGNDKANDLAKAGAMLDEGFMAEARAQEQYSRKERRCTQLCSMQPASIAWSKNGKIVKSSGPSRKKSGSFWTRRVRMRGSVQTGVRKHTSIDV